MRCSVRSAIPCSPEWFLVSFSKADVIQTITLHRDDIAALGVTAIGLIGSIARNEAHDASDLDVVIDLPPEHQTLREYFAVIDWLEAQFGCHVDVLMLDTLRPRFRRAVERDIIWVDLSGTGTQS